MGKLSTSFVSSIIALALVACGGSSKKAPTTADKGGAVDGTGTGAPAGDAAGKSLYERLGGKDSIVAVIDNFVAKVVADERINARFANADAANLKKQLVDQVCAATGGPCKYEGKDMKAAHEGMMITEEEWSALVEDLKATLDELKVPAKEQSELLGALGPMKGDIVGH